MTLDDPLLRLKGIGPSVAKLYAKLGITTVGHLIDYYPRAYDDYSVVSPIHDLRPGTVTIKAVIKQIAGRYARRGLHITEAVASDESGSVRLVWFNQPYRATSLQSGRAYFISGTYELSHQRFAIMSPALELVSDLPVQTARILPVYRETKGLTSRHIRQAMHQVRPLLTRLPETLPAWLVRDANLASRAEALTWLHFPATGEELARARERLGFEEVFDLSLASLLNKREIMVEQAPAVPFVEEVARAFVAQLPFRLTDAQRKAVWQVYKDMAATQPMNRLVEGDVGSGKTVVAAMAAAMVLHHGHQVALMAPTELLARQHADTLCKLLEPHGLATQLGLLVGSMSAAEKQRARDNIAAGRARFVVGTQALIQDTVDFSQLELIIIDEQHRFGVGQRTELIAKAGHMPHVLNLTATPIPRSLALTLYGELDISVLDAKPAGRQPVVTELVPPSSRPAVYERIRQELAAGRQLFVVCPLISESDAHSGSSAEKVYEQLAKKDFRQFRVGLLHGK
ncbi:MAG TPA: ATP-dependent DNA helicase RecG, partial [Candidatus Saccharimonadales bacterium]|nr:ATP-dependent DNA helicase RecG [Candidatus Saccharimonadales bacterium]